MCKYSLITIFLFFSLPVWAEHQGEPGNCNPPCRAGFMCKVDKCISLCNPPCGSGERCINGECEPLCFGDYLGVRHNYLAVMGGVQAGLNSSAKTMGDIHLEFGGYYAALQIGPTLGDHLTILRTAVQGHVLFRITPKIPLYAVPTIALGYGYGWSSEVPNEDINIHDFFITPGLRLRYDILPRLAIFADLFQLQISYLRLSNAGRSDSSSTSTNSKIDNDYHRIDAIPVTWNIMVGPVFLY